MASTSYMRFPFASRESGSTMAPEPFFDDDPDTSVRDQTERAQLQDLARAGAVVGGIGLAVLAAGVVVALVPTE